MLGNGVFFDAALHKERRGKKQENPGGHLCLHYRHDKLTLALIAEG